MNLYGNKDEPDPIGPAYGDSANLMNSAFYLTKAQPHLFGILDGHENLEKALNVEVTTDKGEPVDHFTIIQGGEGYPFNHRTDKRIRSFLSQ